MDPEGPFAFRLGMVLTPWAVRLWVLDEFRNGSGIPKGGKVWERFRRRVKAIEYRKSVLNTTNERGNHMPVSKAVCEIERPKALRASEYVRRL